jgi:hypothetical protein
MENNWKEKILNEFILDIKNDTRFSKQEIKELVDRFEIFGNLVFETTKKECAEEAGDLYDKDSILNIKKPNL